MPVSGDDDVLKILVVKVVARDLGPKSDRRVALHPRALRDRPVEEPAKPTPPGRGRGGGSKR